MGGKRGPSLVVMLQARVAGAILKRAAALAADAAAAAEAASTGASPELPEALAVRESALLMCCQVLMNLYSAM